jgi:hypothetical protein
MLMRKETLDKVGLLDEAFFMYGEDIDLSYRIVLGGYKNYYFPGTRIIHYKGESTKKSSVNYVFVFYRAMVIFAEKHFSQRNAKVFSFFINLAIYLRAGMAIVSRFIKRAALPALDALVIFGAMYFIKEEYETFTSRTYNLEFINQALVLYTLIWMVAVFFNGGYDKPVKLYKILRGIAIGTIAILAFYSLLPESLRFSRALILFGTASTAAVYMVSRYALNIFGIRDFGSAKSRELQVAIVADVEEFARIKSLLDDTGALLKSVMRIAPENAPEALHASADRLSEIVNVYKIDTLIFSGQDVPANKIIGLMAEVESSQLDFKIAPPESLYIIGSNSIEKGGELFIMDLNAVSKTTNRRKKRWFDIATASLFIGLSPLLIWWVDQKSGYFQNAFTVLMGRKSWVGYAAAGADGKRLPSLKQGVLNPTDRVNAQHITEDTARKLNAVYARDYSIRNDLHILSAGFRRLGRRKA